MASLQQVRTLVDSAREISEGRRWVVEISIDRRNPEDIEYLAIVGSIRVMRKTPEAALDALRAALFLDSVGAL